MDAVANSKFYMDFNGLEKLKVQAEQHKPEALDKVAKQFESLFLQTIMKNMRTNNEFISNKLFESNEMSHYQEMHDKQLAMILSERGVGISDVIKRQLQHSQHQGNATKKMTLPLPFDNALPEPVQNENLIRGAQTLTKAFTSKTDFIRSLWNDAKQVAERLGVDPKALIAQAALETGWGKKIIKHGNGQSTHNLFGIKADPSWQQAKASVGTLEYRNGIAKKERAAFRSYPSFAESFADYGRFLTGNNRYNQALASTENPHQFVKELQKAGYATDPNYANKIIKIMESKEFKQLGL